MVRKRSVALLGYPAVGKSSLAYQFVESRFEEEYITTIGNRLTKIFSVEGLEFEMTLYDSMGVTEQPDFPEDLMVMDGWIIVFSVNNRRSFEVAQEIYEKLLHNAGTSTLPVVLVGNKSDLTSEREVSSDEAKRLAAGHQTMYLETSAKTNENVENVFRGILFATEDHRGEPIKKKGDCVLL